MPADIHTSLIGIVSLWAASVLYGINIVMFIICIVILGKRKGSSVPLFLLVAICLQFLLSTAHIGAALGAGVHAFKTVSTGTAAKLISTWISVLGTYTELQQIFYAISNYIGDLILIWRLYVVYGNNWYITILPLLLATASEACTLYGALTTITDPAKIIQATTTRKSPLAQVVTAGFAMTAATQIFVTTLLAAKIYSATRSFGQFSQSRGTPKRNSAYSGILWMLVESGATMAAVEIIFLGVWRKGLSGLSQFTLAVLGQLCAIVPLSIVARVGLRLAFEGTTQGSVAQVSGYSSSRNRSGGSNSLPPVRFAPGPESSTFDDNTVHLSEFKSSLGSRSEGKVEHVV